MQWTRHASSAPAPTELPVRSDHERITTSEYCVRISHLKISMLNSS